MNRFSLRFLAVVCCFLECATLASSQEGIKQPLRLVQTISIPNVKGRLDHMEVDVQGKRLFVAGLENGTFEVADLRAGKWTRSIPGFKKPQGALYIPELNKLFLASGDDGMVRVFRGDTLQLLDSIELEPGPNRIVYEPNFQSGVCRLRWQGCRERLWGSRSHRCQERQAHWRYQSDGAFL